jgi:hypothetical protein
MPNPFVLKIAKQSAEKYPLDASQKLGIFDKGVLTRLSIYNGKCVRAIPSGIEGFALKSKSKD